MNILAIDTCLEACSVAVCRDGTVLDQRSEVMARGHQERLAPMVAEAMADPTLGAFVARLMRDDIVPSLRAPPGFGWAFSIKVAGAVTGGRRILVGSRRL